MITTNLWHTAPVLFIIIVVIVERGRVSKQLLYSLQQTIHIWWLDIAIHFNSSFRILYSQNESMLMFSDTITGAINKFHWLYKYQDSSWLQLSLSELDTTTNGKYLYVYSCLGYAFCPVTQWTFSYFIHTYTKATMESLTDYSNYKNTVFFFLASTLMLMLRDANKCHTPKNAAQLQYFS